MAIDLYQQDILTNYVGHGAIICQANRDQGDSAQREGLYISFLSLANHNVAASDRMNKALSELRVEPGVYRRSSDPKEWYYNPNNLSRDQRAILELGMAITNNKKELGASAKYILKRGGFHQNTHPGTDPNPKAWKVPDFISPGELAVYIRGLGMWYMYPVLTILDLGLVADIYFRSKWDGANMSAVNILYANKKYPTIFSTLAKRLMPKSAYKEEIINYYSLEKNGIPPLGDMYVEVINMHTSGN